LTRRLATEINELGGDAIHTLDLPDSNRTTDAAIIERADREGRVVITKDSDFVDSLLLRGKPSRLLFVATGNISNNALVHLIHANWIQIESMFSQGCYVELGRNALTLHF
jgi:predicted nuclease of predicted toxin-antitoxin system